MFSHAAAAQVLSNWTQGIPDWVPGEYFKLNL